MGVFESGEEAKVLGLLVSLNVLDAEQHVVAVPAQGDVTVGHVRNGKLKLEEVGFLTQRKINLFYPKFASFVRPVLSKAVVKFAHGIF